MRIKSNFKDYYDFIAFKYGGGDPKITYCRSARISQELDFSFIDNNERRMVEFCNEECVKKYYNDLKLPSCHIKFLIFCGKVYPIISFATKKENPLLDGSFSTVFENYKVVKKDDPVLNELYKYRNFMDYIDGKNKKIPNYYGKKCCFDFAIKNKLPVFVIEFKYRSGYSVDEYIPNLGELGFGGILSPEQCYQELSYFIANVMCESPDIKLPCEINNEERIIAAGFDLKNSFRNTK